MNHNHKKIFLIIGIVISAVSNSYSQTVYEDYQNDQNEYTEEEIVEDPKFFDDINQSRFNSNLNNIEESRRIDYSSGSSRQSREFNVFGKENEISNYQFKAENENSVQGNGSNNITISSGGTWEQMPSTTSQTPNSNSPSVANPFGTNPGVKNPRNMDAVPDNGSDPNDVPLDGGIGILAMAAAAYGLRRFKK